MAKINTTEGVIDTAKQDKKDEQDMKQQEQQMAAQLRGEKTVRIKIPLINRNDPDVIVGINGAFLTIKRGETVDVPESAVEVLEHAGLI